MSSELALLGGRPLVSEKWPVYNSIGAAEKEAVMRVLDRGVLSQFIGRDHPYFEGGPEVRALQEEWQNRFGVRHAVAVNSATSGLYAAIGAVDPEVGDEIIVSPYTMIASATCCLAFNAIPVFADISPDNFCLDPDSIEPLITKRTRAIVVVHIFGLPADMDGIMELARRHDLKVIEDCAQSPGAMYKNRPVGGIGDIGVFSLNAHKVVQCGEGGVCVTNDDELALRLKLIRNHGEACVESMGYERISNIVGQNYRMGEMEAAVAREQLKKLDGLNEARVRLADHLSVRLADIPEVIPPAVGDGKTHVYYVYPMKLDVDRAGISRDLFVDAVAAEGIDVYKGYVPPIYLEPMYQKRIAFGSRGFPWNSPYVDRQRFSEKGDCPVCERMYERELFFTPLIYPPLTETHMDLMAEAMEKVLDRREELMDHEKQTQAAGR